MTTTLAVRKIQSLLVFVGMERKGGLDYDGMEQKGVSDEDTQKVGT